MGQVTRRGHSSSSMPSVCLGRGGWTTARSRRARHAGLCSQRTEDATTAGVCARCLILLSSAVTHSGGLGDRKLEKRGGGHGEDVLFCAVCRIVVSTYMWRHHCRCVYRGRGMGVRECVWVGEGMACKRSQRDGVEARDCRCELQRLRSM